MAFSPSRKFQWIVSQIGARQHYAVPRIFEAHGELDSFYTDLWCRCGARLLKRGNRVTRAFAGRFHPALPSQKVISFSTAAFVNALSRRLGGRRGGIHDRDFYAQEGRIFSERVNACLDKRELDPAVHAFFGFSSGSLETLAYMKARGILTILDQMDLGRIEKALEVEESLRWPGWAISTFAVPEELSRRQEKEWELATIILVNSEWSRKALIQQGVVAKKIIVVPLAYEPPPFEKRPEFSRRETLKVLWLGTVTLRKGIQYLIEAAKLVKDAPVEFIIAGPIEISSAALATAPPNMQFLGRITRDKASTIFRQAQVFVLPTLSDGFAITQLEAMGHGLPVIATPNCGQVVTHGSDGLIIPPADPVALAEAVLNFEKNRADLPAMSERARLKANQFSLKHYHESFSHGVTSVLLETKAKV